MALSAALTIGMSVLVVAPVSAGAPERDRQLRARITALLPDDYRARLAALDARLDVSEGDPRDIAEAVIDPDDYECGTTELTTWLEASVADWTPEDFENVLVVILLNLVFYDALLFPEPAAGRYFGADGEYTGKLQRSFGNLQRFWDIDGRDIEMVPAHGGTLRDVPRMTRVLQFVLELPEAEAAEAAAALAAIVDQPKYDYGNHPIFTFNAFAFTADGQEFPGAGIPTDKIIMGDGMLDGFRAIGLSDVAPNAILGHEYGHHIQFERDLFASPLPGPEATRRTELMADAFSTYWASHKRGENLRWNRVRKTLQTFYNIGDCAFDDVGHHGTPNQRLRAADWGHDIAVRSWPPTRVLPSLTFARLFERKLPALVAPDAG
ncbi:hypothetical protein MB27_24760 [Actinoplanes utahensis]|uniref:Uncharacterized protein n=2 Tax=Actinoplanes utahensis TaxID=1869 RepID=A0A0A6UGF2_ACTUT|nr:hypothetical protein MB27_24760 [Actinoplanes utahensis]